MKRELSRRSLLRGTGAAAIGLPLLDAMAFAGTAPPPKRFVAMCAGLGFHTPYLFPEKPGRGYPLTPLLEKLKDNREKITPLSGFCHPDQQGNNGHASELTWLTSAKRPGLAGFKNTISVDQLIAAKIGIETRFPYLAVSTSGRSLSWTSNGVEIPGERSPGKLFKALFINGTKEEIANEVRDLERGRSILDTVRGEARNLDGALGHRDRGKLEEYFASVRDLEKRLEQFEAWATRPKPKVSVEAPKDISDRNDAIAKQRLMYDMIVLALRTDSTRTITFSIGGMNAVPSNLPGVTSDWHNLSHHGKDEDKIRELKIIEEAEFVAFGKFLSDLDAVKEEGSTLLERTSVLFGSNLGNASSHNWHNLPLVLAGGGYRHGTYVARDPENNTPFANILLALAQRMGIETDRFGSSTASGIEGVM